MPINVNLFGHILLDAELNGRFGVQGNTFKNTFAYFNTWLEQYLRAPTFELGEANQLQLNALQQSMKQLCEEEASIKALNNLYDHDNEKLNSYTRAMAKAIKALPPNGTLMLPGGWSNKKGSGHAMIYEFKKNSSGQLEFSIYNSGAGIERHKRQGDSVLNKFYPVRTHQLLAPEDNQLAHLVETLVLPQIPVHPERNYKPSRDPSKIHNYTENYDAEILYQKMDFATSTHPVINQYSDGISTTGQISGTCSQRSIHQMIKVHFDTLPHYQRFILEFKMHALREFITEHPIPRSKEINEFIILGIENNLKILQEPNVFDDIDAKNALIEESIRLKQDCLTSQATKKQKNTQHFVMRNTEYYLPSSFNDPAIVSEEASLVNSTRRIKPEFIQLHNQEKLNIDQFHALLDNCKKQLQTDPYWVIQQIEQALIHLPLPNNHQAFKDEIPFYLDIKSNDQFNELIDILGQLSHIHQEANQVCLGSNVTSTTLVTHISFIALYQYFSDQYASLHDTPSLKGPIQGVLTYLFAALKHMPHMATQHAAHDQRVKQLEQLHVKIGSSPISIVDYYQTLLNVDPKIKLDLEQAYYESSNKPDADTCIWLQKNKCEALYYLFTQLDEKGNLQPTSSLTSEAYTPLLTNIKRAINFEQRVAEHTNIFFDMEDYQPQVRIQKTRQGGLDIQSPLNYIQNLIHKPGFHFTPEKFNQLLLNQAKMPPSSILQALIPKHTEQQYEPPFHKPRWFCPTNNEIQLNEKSFFMRDLYQLRTSKKNQIQLTLDYFYSKMDKLSDPDIQQYVMLNLFEPGLLCDFLKTNTSNILAQFDDFIEKGLIHALDKNGNISHTSLYFIQLSLSVNCYMAAYKQSNTPSFTQRLINDYHRINRALDSTTNPSILSELHRHRFIALMTLQKNEDQISEAQFSDCLSSFFQVQNQLTGQATTLMDKFALQKLVSEYEDRLGIYVANNPSALTTTIKTQACNLLKIAPAECELSGEYPIYKLNCLTNGQAFSINAPKGHIFNEQNLRLSPIPFELQSHPELQRLHLPSDLQWFISMDGLSFTSEDGNIRLKRDPTSQNNITSIQKKWVINDAPASWYELQTKQAMQSLPASLCDDNCASWANKKNAFVTKNNQPRYFLTQQGIEQLDDHAKANKHYLQSSSRVHEALSSFEASTFLHVNLSQDQQTGTIELPRYGLNFIVDNDTLQLSHTPYTLTTSAASPFEAEVASITCEDPQKNQLCIVPVQRFYVDTNEAQTAGHQFKLTHDISALIEKDTLSNKPPSAISYTATEKTIAFPLIGGVPQPNNASDALYLAYLYLATHEHEKAWNVLNTIPKRFPMQGTQQELTYLSWIVNALPYAIKDTDEDMALQSPRDVACQLKAMSLYTTFLSEGKKTQLAKPDNIDIKAPNAICTKHDIEQVFAFRQQLAKHIENQSLQLVQMERHLSDHFTLTDEENISLLNYWHTDLIETSPDTAKEPNVVLEHKYQKLVSQKGLRIQAQSRVDTHQPPIPINAIHSNQSLCLRDVIAKAIGKDETLSVEEKKQLNDQLDKFYLADTICINRFNQLDDSNELMAGEALYQRNNDQRHIATEALSNLKVRNRLSQHTKDHQSVLAHEADKSWDAILLLANEALNTNLKVQVAAGQRPLLTKHDLLCAYMHADDQHYQKISALPQEKVAKLHNMLHQCMLLEIEKQHAERLEKALNDVSTEPHPMQLATIASVLTSQHLPEAKSDPKLIFFQYAENILLRPRQLQALSNLLSDAKGKQGFNESIEKVIMGGGKSKVILPLLAQKKANGSNLVILEVPRSLLATNHTDLLRTSQQLFGQNAFCFDFDRDSDCSPKRLEEIYHQFCDISLGKNYLVTTGEAMQSLELKYLELLLSKPASTNTKAIETWKAQIHWASNIVQLLKQRGDVVIDEVHQGLLLKKKLNYTLGTPVPIEQTLIQQTLDLYQFLRNKSFIHAEIDTSKLLKQLLTDPTSPLKAALHSLFCTYGDTEELIGELERYLSNESQPDWLEALDPKLKNSLAFYKEQLELLPQTLNRHYKEHYGPSQKNNRPAFQRALAIPYSANDKPNERSQFGNPLETLNYTIQALFREGLNQELLIALVNRWQQDARFEFQHGEFDSLDATPMAKCVAELLKNTSFSSLNAIDSDNPEQIVALLDQARYEPKLLEHVLEHMILPEIKREPATLHSDAFNHVELYRSTQGISGTPANHSTFHQRLHFNATTSLGSDGYIQTVLKNKKTPIIAARFDNVETYLKTLLTSKSTHAIIDINATFVGLNNLEVTHALANHLKKQNTDIKYVLYFKENAAGNDVLHAYNIHEEKSIELASSDPKEINRQLNCQPEHCFTYYDQAHTVGVDLKQAPNASALCLIDQETPLQSFLQGVMRMRGLDEEQTIELIVPPSMSNQSLDTLLDGMQRNEANQLSQDNFYATLAKLHNIIRRQALSHLASVEDVDTKHHYAEVFRDFLIETHSHELFDEFGSIYQKQSTDVLLKNHLDSLLLKWQERLHVLHIVDDKDALKTELTEIVKQALPLCPKTFKSPLHHQQNTEVEVQKEVMKENETKKEVQKLVENIVELGQLKPIKIHQAWDTDKLKDITFNGFFNEKILDASCPQFKDDFFSSGLRVTERYIETFEEQTDKQALSAYLKPVQCIMYRMDQNNNVTACLISNEEANELSLILNNIVSNELITPTVWLETTKHTCLAGKRPSDANMQADYHVLTEQIRFFNGEFAELLDQPTPYLWLDKQPQEALATFDELLMPYRETTQRQLSLLNQALSKQPEGLCYIAEHAFDDLTSLDWHAKYPKALPFELATLTNLANAISQANQMFHTSESYSNLSRLLPETAKSVFNKHDKQLTNINSWLQRFEMSEPDQLLLNILKPDEAHELEALLGINLNLLKTIYSINDSTPTTTTEMQLLNLHLLLLLIQSPCLGNYSLIEMHAKQQLAKMDDAFANISKHKPLLPLLLMKNDLSAQEVLSVLEQIDISQAHQTTLESTINHPNIAESTLVKLLNEAPLTPKLVDHITKQTTSTTTLALVIEKYPPTLKQAIFLAAKNPSLNIQKHLIEGCKTDPDFQSIQSLISDCHLSEVDTLLKLPLTFESINSLLTKTSNEKAIEALQKREQDMQREYESYKSSIENKDDFDETRYKELLQSHWFTRYRKDLFGPESVKITPPQKRLILKYADPALTPSEIATFAQSMRILMRQSDNVTFNQCKALAQYENPRTLDLLLNNDEAVALIFGHEELAISLINNAETTKETLCMLIALKEVTPIFVRLCTDCSRFKGNIEIIKTIAEHQNSNIQKLIFEHEELAASLINNAETTEETLCGLIAHEEVTPEFVCFCTDCSRFKGNIEINKIIAEHQNPIIQKLASTPRVPTKEEEEEEQKQKQVAYKEQIQTLREDEVKQTYSKK